MSEIKRLVDGWSNEMGAAIGAFDGFDDEERILARALVSTLRRQLRKMKRKEEWHKLGEVFRMFQSRLPTATEGDIAELMASPAFKAFMNDAEFSMEDIEDFSLTEVVEELHKFAGSSVVQKLFAGVIQLAEEADQCL